MNRQIATSTSQIFLALFVPWRLTPICLKLPRLQKLNVGCTLYRMATFRSPDDTQDTQPTRPGLQDTRPYRPLRPISRLIWLLLVFAFLAVLTVALILRLMGQTAPRSPVAVTLIVDGSQYTTNTTAATVRDLLIAENISLNAGFAVSPAPETAITPNLTVIVDDVRSVTLTVNGLTSVFRTVVENPQDILDSAGITVEAGDQVRVNGALVPPARLGEFPLPANHISVQHALSITVEADGQTQTITTTAATVGEALFNAGITLFLGDTVEPPLDTPLQDGLHIVVTRSTPITIQADGITLETRTQGQTVGDALFEAKIPLSGLDYTLPSEVATLRPGMVIEVIRVREEVQTEQIPVPFEAVYEADAEMELDTTAVVQAGVNGVDQKNIRVRYENDVEISREDEGITRVQEPVNQVIRYGTKIVYRTVDTPEGPKEYWRKLRVYATSYHPAALGGDDVTATGRKLQKGVVGIDPRLIPYDTTLYVPNYGIGVAADTGGPRSSRYWIDLGYSDDDWVSWSRWVDVYLLAPPPERFPYILP